RTKAERVTARLIVRRVRDLAKPAIVGEQGELIRTHLVHVPARIAHSARRITLHLPHNWPWQHAWTHLFSTAHGPAG
ncbi:hypothetical protein ACFVRD_45170, partial [Streptomyces sp. NPDC057908]